MKRFIVELILLATTFMAGCGPEGAPGAAQPATRATQATASVVGTATSQVATVAATALPTPVLSPQATVAELDLAQAPSPLPTPTATSMPGDSIPMAASPTSAPTPDVNKVTVPELDNIRFANRQPLLLPEGLDSFSFGSTVWSPDGQRFLGAGPSDDVIMVGNIGQGFTDLYQGTAEDDVGQLKLITHNADVPWWSRDGSSAYYLSLHSDGSKLFWDLYKLSLTTGASELVASDVARPYLPAPAAQETSDGRILTLDREHRPSLVTVVDGKTSLTPLATFLGLSEYASTAGYVSLAPDGHTIALIPSLGRLTEDGIRRSFIDRPGERPVIIADLKTNTVIDTLPGPVDTFRDVSWTSDSRKLAYAGSEGVSVYDLNSKDLEILIERTDLGFPEDRTMSGFERPIWSPDQRIVLFLTGTPGWEQEVAGYMGYLLGATSDGAYWKGIGPVIIESVVPNGEKALIVDMGLDKDDSSIQPMVMSVAEIEWR